MIYDVAIIGGGASGLLAGASLPKDKSAIILEKSMTPGKKLLLSGALQCNLTHGGNIKDFLVHYGKQGKKIRNILYGFNNEKVIEFFESRNVKCFVRDDGKVFPLSLKSKDILNALIEACENNNVEIICKSQVKNISAHLSNNVNFYSIDCDATTYKAKSIIIATGGASYPTTGSDGNFYNILHEMSIEVIPPSPALVPVKVHDYPYAELSGISFENVQFSVESKNNAIELVKLVDDLLFTHNSFSGPCVLNTSRYIKAGDKITINYLPKVDVTQLLKNLKQLSQGNNTQISTFLQSNLGDSFPKRFIEVLCSRLKIDTTAKTSSLSGENLKSIVEILSNDSFSVSGLAGFNLAMATAGGVSLEEVTLKNLELKKYPGIHVIGESLDIDGDTGGYNLQFAFSSGYLAAKQI